MKVFMYKVWFSVVEWWYHLTMSLLKWAGRLRAYSHKKATAPPPLDCDACTKKEHWPGYEPIEWVPKDGSLYPVYRLAAFRWPFLDQRIVTQQGTPIQQILDALSTLPKDTKVLDIKHGLYWHNAIEFLVQSAEFPETVEGAAFPQLRFIRSSRIVTNEELAAGTQVNKIIEYISGWRIDPWESR